MLDNLQQRLHVLDETERARRASVWGSHGSASSSNGTAAYYSPPQSMSQGTAMYQPTAPQMPPLQQSYTDVGVSQQTNPSMYQQQQPPMQPQQQYFAPQAPPYAQMQQQYDRFQQPEQPVVFGNPLYRAPSHQTAPGSQFAAWSGYGGASSGPDTLDDENAVPPNSFSRQSSKT